MKRSGINTYLVIGVGNSSRQDDGIAWWLLDQLKALQLPADLEYRYQLNLEDAELMARYKKVFIVDASHNELQEGYDIYKLEESPPDSIFSHQVSPATIQHLISRIFKANPEITILEIGGKDWDFGNEISSQAKMNAKPVIKFLVSQMEESDAPGETQ